MSQRPWGAPLAGELVQLEVDSAALRGNPLGDPVVRPLLVYLPPTYVDGGARRFPAVYLLQGFGGFVTSWTNRRAFEFSVPELIDRAIATGTVPPCIVVYVDAWTSLGGSQFVDSPGTGDYHSYLCEDVVEVVDRRFRTLADRNHRAVMGHSSGGYGALVSAMWRPDVFGALASHAGDALFEYSLLPEFAAAYRALRDRYGGSVEAFLDELRDAPARGVRPDLALSLVYGCAACYSARGDGSVELPFSLEHGGLREDVFARWLELDPVRMVPERAAALGSLRAIYIDAGRGDEFHLDVGAELLATRMAEAGIADVHLELFAGTHRGSEWRYAIGLRHIVEAISA